MQFIKISSTASLFCRFIVILSLKSDVYRSVEQEWGLLGGKIQNWCKFKNPDSLTSPHCHAEEEGSSRQIALLWWKTSRESWLFIFHFVSPLILCEAFSTLQRWRWRNDNLKFISRRHIMNVNVIHPRVKSDKEVAENVGKLITLSDSLFVSLWWNVFPTSSHTTLMRFPMLLHFSAQHSSF